MIRAKQKPRVSMTPVVTSEAERVQGLTAFIPPYMEAQSPGCVGGWTFMLYMFGVCIVFWGNCGV